MNMKKLIIAAMLLLAIPAFSESPNPPPADCGPEMSKKKHHECGAPIDSGAWILIGLAGIYGVYKIVEIRRNHAKPTD